MGASKHIGVSIQDARQHLKTLSATARKSPSRAPVKECYFLCGTKSTDKSPVRPQMTVEWESSTGRGNSDLYCYTVWRHKYKHIRDRSAQRDHMLNNMDAMAEFMNLRRVVISRRLSGQCGFSYGDKGFATRAKKSLVSKRTYKEALLPPAPDVLPWEDYKAMVSPNIQKSAGHFLKRIDGRKVVVMPAPKGTPWKLQQEFGSSREAMEVIHEQVEGEASGVESGDDAINDMFDDLRGASEQTFKAAVQGATFEELMAKVQAEEAASAGAAASSADAEQVDTAGSAAASSSKGPALTAQRKKAKRPFFGLCSDSSEDRSPAYPHTTAATAAAAAAVAAACTK